ncbi:MAG: ion channel [Granulosicoccus sp.]
MVMFTTLGYGDYTEDYSALNIASSVQAMFGLGVTGRMIAGFVSKSKN